MKPRVTILKFLLFACVFCCVSSIAVAATKVASVAYVDSSIKRNSNGIEIQNTTNSPATLSQNPQTTAVSTTSKEVATVGWTDANRTSKVRSGGASGTTLIDMWIE